MLADSSVLDSEEDIQSVLRGEEFGLGHAPPPQTDQEYIAKVVQHEVEFAVEPSTEQTGDDEYEGYGSLTEMAKN